MTRKTRNPTVARIFTVRYFIIIIVKLVPARSDKPVYQRGRSAAQTSTVSVIEFNRLIPGLCTLPPRLPPGILKTQGRQAYAIGQYMVGLFMGTTGPETYGR